MAQAETDGTASEMDDVLKRHADLFCQRCGALGSQCRCAEEEHLEAERREQANLHESIVERGGNL